MSTSLPKYKLPEYWSWQRMKQRCYDKNATDYAYYGGKGITVCDRWLTFENYYADVGSRPEGMTLDRIDNLQGYTPENCRWASKREQSINRSMTRWITHDGVTLCKSDWAKRVGITKQCLQHRLKMGWPLERALAK